MHCHPSVKVSGNYWAIDLETTGTFRSPLMGWGRASFDTFSNNKTSVNLMFGRMSDAVSFAAAQGWGFDISCPVKHQRWFVKKNYADNFKFKGHPGPTEQYD